MSPRPNDAGSVSISVSNPIPAPLTKHDLERMILPSRACLLSIRDIQSKARRMALEDSLATARKATRQPGQPDRVAATILATFWETICCLELAANTAAPWVDPQIMTPSGLWVEMTRYDPGRATRFYESSHKWPDERYAVLSGHRFRHGDSTSMLDAFREGGIDDQRVTQAFAEIETATAHLLREHFERLRTAWNSMRAYAASFEHGLLLVPSEVGAVVDVDDDEIPHALVTWDRNGHSRGLEGSGLPAITAAEDAGHLALDLAEYTADSRMRVIDALYFVGDHVYLRPVEQPLSYWVRRGDLSPDTLEVLNGFRIDWVDPESAPAGQA